MEVEAITELTKEIRALPLATIAFVAVIAALVVVAIVVIVSGRGSGRFFSLLQPLTDAVNRFTSMFDRRMDETNTREMFQTQMMMSAATGINNVSQATAKLVDMAEKSYSRMLYQENLELVRHDELMRAINHNMSTDRLRQIVREAVRDEGRVLFEEWREGARRPYEGDEVGDAGADGAGMY